MTRRTALLTSLLAPALRSEEPSHWTNGFLNGRSWRTMSLNERGSYVMAVTDAANRIAEGFSLLSIIPSDKKESWLFWMNQTYSAAGFSYSDVADKITLLYQDPANLNLAIIDVCTVAFHQLNGWTQQRAEEALESMRKSAREKQ